MVFILVNTVHGQQEIKGKVIDRENAAFLANVHIMNLEDSTIIVTNALGEFKLKKLGTYRFTRLGYHEKEIEIVSSKFIIIQLEVKYSELNEVVVSTNQIPLNLRKSVASISILSATQIERGNNVNITPLLNNVPGVYMQTGALNTNRIMIRGIGSRNLFGTAKIRAYFEDIPLTTGNGETEIEDFELNSIGRLEIIKGAASSIYGAGLGGTIHLIPKKPYFDHTSINSEFALGSYGLIKGTLNVNHGGSKNSIRAVYSHTQADGYRDNNDYDRQTFTFVSNHYINENNDISFVSSYVDLKAFIPSSINENDFRNNPTAAAFAWERSQGYEDTKRGIFGLSWKHVYKNNLKQHSSIFTSIREGYEPRPFNILTENTFATGLRSRLLGNTDLFKKKLDWTFGGELFHDRYNSKTYENLYQDFPIGTGSVQGSLLSNFKENRNYFNLFFEANYHLSDRIMLSFGMNYNETSYDLKDKYVTAENPDQSGDYRFDGVLSPKIGISHSILETLDLFGTVSHGFSPPTISETLLPDGQINTAIEPETGWNFEIGLRANLFDKHLQLSSALFRLDVRNLLVARRTEQDQFIGVNAGKTQHDGLELSIDYHLIRSDALKINSYFSYTLNNFIFKEFIDDNQDFSGNDLTGVPSRVLNAGVDVSSALGIYGNINFQYVGSMPITDSNSLFTDSYKLANIKLGYKLKVTKKLILNAFLGIDNIFNEVYASQILINASAFGGNAPRYYYPGTPLNYYTGIKLNYVF